MNLLQRLLKTANRPKAFGLSRRKAYSVEALESRLVLAAPVAVVDMYSTPQGETLQVEAAGVLANDSDSDGDPMTAQLIDDVTSGSLTLAADGSFEYVPDPGFFGADQFTYRAVSTSSVIPFQVDPTQSSVDFGAEVSAGIVAADDSDRSKITGTIVVDLRPPHGPFDQIQIIEMDLVLADGVDLRFCFGEFFGNCLAGTLRVDADPGAISIFMEQPGSPTTVDGDDFIQTGNLLGISGTAVVSGTGTVGNQLDPNPRVFDLDTFGMESDLSGSIIQQRRRLALSSPLFFDGQFEQDGITVAVSVTGNVVAMANVPSPEFSEIVTVTIHVSPPPLPGDLDGDQKVGISDLLILQQHFGTSGSPSEGDLNGDGQIDEADFRLMVSAYGNLTEVSATAASPAPLKIMPLPTTPIEISASQPVFEMASSGLATAPSRSQTSGTDLLDATLFDATQARLEARSRLQSRMHKSSRSIRGDNLDRSLRFNLAIDPISPDLLSFGRFLS